MTMVDAFAAGVSASSVLDPSDQLVPRHIGPNDEEIAQMLARVGCGSLDELIDQVVPASIRMKGKLKLGSPRGENELLAELHTMAQKNTLMRSYIGMGYHGTITPPVILRNVLRTRVGTRSTRPTKPRSRRVGFRHCSISKQWFRI